MSDHLFIISVLYGISGFAYLFIAIRGIVRKNELKIFDLIRLMYSFVYGFIPCLLYSLESNGQRNLYFYDYGLYGLTRIYLMWFFSWVAYGLMNLAYYSIKHNQKSIIISVNAYNISIRNKANRLVVCGVISLIIGFICLFFWTKAYGSLWNFIINAPKIRSGIGKINNPLAFLKHFVGILPLSLYSFFSAYLFERPKNLRRVLYFSLLAISIIGNYLYFLASDSRITITFIGVAVLFIGMRHRKREKISWYLFWAAIIVFVLLNATMFADTFSNYVRNGEWRISTGGLIERLTKEFRFIISSDMRVIKAWISGDLKIQIGNDILTSITSWIPERFLPFKIPATLWKYNTNLYSYGSSGTSPTSLVATSIYELGLIGILIIPFIFGLLAGVIERMLKRNKSAIYSDVYYGLFAGLFVQMVSHNQISTFVTKLFPLFVFFVISKLVDCILCKREDRDLSYRFNEDTETVILHESNPSDSAEDDINSSDEYNLDNYRSDLNFFDTLVPDYFESEDT